MRTPYMILLFACPVSLLGPDGVYIKVMQQAQTRASAHGSTARPAVSDGNDAILSDAVPIAALHRDGYKVIGGISDDPVLLRRLVGKGIDGYINDRPDILMGVLAEEIAATANEDEKRRLRAFDVQAHRGGRGLRPESTLPSFENGLDLGSTTLEMDTGVSSDHIYMIWHDEYYDPAMCRRVDGSEYKVVDRVWIQDKRASEIQKQFICDKTPFGADQQNSLKLSPISVAFAKKLRLPSAYSPRTIDQIFQFVRFYVSYYQTGPGRKTPLAKKRVADARIVRFDLETKLIPDFMPDDKGAMERTMNRTAEPQAFVSALCPAVIRNRMDRRSEIQSFDFRTLRLVEEQYPSLPTYYLTSSPKLFKFQTTPPEAQPCLWTANCMHRSFEVGNRRVRHSDRCCGNLVPSCEQSRIIHLTSSFRQEAGRVAIYCQHLDLGRDTKGAPAIHQEHIQNPLANQLPSSHVELNNRTTEQPD